MFASLKSQLDSYDVSMTTICMVGTAVLAAAMCTRTTTPPTTATTTTTTTPNQQRSASLCLPKEHYLLRLATQKQPNHANVEENLRTEIQTLVARNLTLSSDLAQERDNCDTLSTQVKEILQGYESAGDYTGIFGKSKEMVQRDHKGYKSSTATEMNSLRLKLADLEHQSHVTRRALEKSKAQTEMAHQSNAPLGGRTPRGGGGRFTFDQGISQMALLRDALALIRSESLRFNGKSIQRINSTLSKISASGDSASILMGRSLGVIKAALVEFCQLDTFTKTSSEWNISLVALVQVPKRRRLTLVESLTLAVAAFDTLVEDDEEDAIENAVVDGFCLNCTLLATLAEFARLEDDECLKRAREREGFKKTVREFDRRGSTISMQAAGLIPTTPSRRQGGGGF